MRFQNIVVTVNTTDAGSEVSLTYPEHVSRMVGAFVRGLPMDDENQEEWSQHLENIRTQTQSASRRAIASLVLGIVGIMGCGLITGIVALVLGRAELKAIDAGESPAVGKGYAKAGLIMGWISVGLTILAVLIGILIGVFEQ